MSAPISRQIVCYAEAFELFVHVRDYWRVACLWRLARDLVAFRALGTLSICTFHKDSWDASARDACLRSMPLDASLELSLLTCSVAPSKIFFDWNWLTMPQSMSVPAIDDGNLLCALRSGATGRVSLCQRRDGASSTASMDDSLDEDCNKSFAAVASPAVLGFT